MILGDNFFYGNMLSPVIKKPYLLKVEQIYIYIQVKIHLPMEL